MTKLNLTSVHGFFVSYDLDTIRDIIYGKAKSFYNKTDVEENGFKLNDAVIVIRFKGGDTASFGDNWTVTFA